MMSPKNSLLPAADEVRRAVLAYIGRAFESRPPASAERFLPPPDADIGDWLMSDVAERSPSDQADLADVRSFALRIGNGMYPNMKLRISRTPNGNGVVFHVDAHDAMLIAPAGSADHGPLQEVKSHNARLTAEITEAWEAEGLLTERAYLRQAILVCRARESIEPDTNAD